jgi:hypothetical protein
VLAGRWSPNRAALARPEFKIEVEAVAVLDG